MPTIPPLIVSIFAFSASIAILTIPMPRYISRSMALIVGWFGLSYALVYWLKFDLPATSLLVRFNLLLLFGIIVACAVAWHIRRGVWKRNG